MSKKEVAELVGKTQGDESMLKIRELLFGEFMHETKTRFLELEKLHLEQIGELTSSIKKIDSRLLEEKSQRETCQTIFEEKLLDDERSFQTELQRMNDTAKASLDSISKLFQEKLHLLEDSLDNQYKILQNTFDHEVDILQSNKLDSETLATMFSELSEQLRKK